MDCIEPLPNDTINSSFDTNKNIHNVVYKIGKLFLFYINVIVLKTALAFWEFLFISRVGTIGSVNTSSVKLFFIVCAFPKSILSIALLNLRN